MRPASATAPGHHRTRSTQIRQDQPDWDRAAAVALPVTSPSRPATPTAAAWPSSDQATALAVPVGPAAPPGRLMPSPSGPSIPWASHPGASRPGRCRRWGAAARVALRRIGQGKPPDLARLGRSRLRSKSWPAGGANHLRLRQGLAAPAGHRPIPGPGYNLRLGPRPPRSGACPGSSARNHSWA